MNNIWIERGLYELVVIRANVSYRSWGFDWEMIDQHATYVDLEDEAYLIPLPGRSGVSKLRFNINLKDWEPEYDLSTPPWHLPRLHINLLPRRCQD